VPIQRLERVFDISESLLLRSRAEAMVDDIKADYFSSLTEDVFRREHLGNTSLVMKIAAYRFANEATMSLLKARLEPIAEKLYAEADLLLHPIFYLRIGYPGNNYSDLYRDAFLDSQPHYDRAFGVDAYSFWVALEDIDDESGGLAEFSSSETDAHFALNDGRNRYNYDLYLDKASEIDEMLKSSCRAPHANIGDVLTFDSSVLHGATKPKSRKRISFDFRLAPRQAIEAASSEVRVMFDAYNRSIDLCNAYNLKFVGDDFGARRFSETIDQNSNFPRPNSKILEPYAQMQWQDEYAFLNHQSTRAEFF
jgi:ectoine hydroxylase-related dioxygenase (phytanoyl-CoA dioxygenase family)